MSTKRIAAKAVLSAGVVLATFTGLAPINTSPAYAGIAAVVPDGEPLNCGTAEVTRTLSTGSAWRMCAHIHEYKGLVLEKVQFKPASGGREYDGWMPVLDSLYLSQLNVPYDTGGVTFDDVTGYGLGADQLVSQSEGTCEGEPLSIEQVDIVGPTMLTRTIPAICVEERSNGLAWHSKENSAFEDLRYTQQERVLELSAISRVGWYEYQQRYTLSDQGAISVALGATGDIGQNDIYFPTDPLVGWHVGPEAAAPDNPGSASHWHNAVYRVDFGIDAGDQAVQEWNYTQPSTSSNRFEGRGTIKPEAFTAPTNVERTTWWRVMNPTSLNVDGHPRSYEIVNDSIQDTLQPLTSPKVTFTNSHPCQEYPWDNLNLECPDADIDDYVAGDTEPLTDPVAWVNVGFHHVVRDEDQSPMPIHWQGFSLQPRDLLAQQATTPIERSCINGGPIRSGGSCAAINTEPPTITAGSGPVSPGSVLLATPGLWKGTRSPLTLTYFWLRDGEPITTTGPDGLPISVTGRSRAITPDDQGHELSVLVQGSGTGLVSGSATSAPLKVPAAPTPSASPSTKAQNPTAKKTPLLRVSVRYISASKARIQVRATGPVGRVTGAVKVSGPKWSRTRTLANGKAVYKVPRALLKRSKRLTISFEGSSTYAPAATAVRLKKTLVR